MNQTTNITQLFVNVVSNCFESNCTALQPNTTQCDGGPVCPRGTRERLDESDITSGQCEPCTDAPNMYAWLYLGFMAFVPILLLLNFTFFRLDNETPEWENKPLRPTSTTEKDEEQPEQEDEEQGEETLSLTSPKHPRVMEPVADEDQEIPPPVHRPWSTYPEWMCGLGYSSLHVLSAIICILLFPPIGSLTLHSCIPQAISSFYTPLFTSMGCINEAVFPYITLPLAYYASSALGCLVFYVVLLLTRQRRPLSTPPSPPRLINRPSKCWLRLAHISLYLYPALCLFVLLFGGYLYFTFPYVLLSVALLHSVHYFPILFDYCPRAPDAVTVDCPLPLCDPRQLIVAMLRYPRVSYLATVLFSMLCYAYSLMAQQQSLLWIINLTLAPFLFYALTVPFTHPFAIHADGENLMQLVTSSLS